MSQVYRKYFRMFLPAIVLAGAALPASAAASPLVTAPTGTSLAVGNRVLFTNVGEIVMTGSVEVRCSAGVMTGTLTKNNGTEFEVTMESASFTGTGASGDCTSSGLGAVKVTKNNSNGFPECLRSTTTADQFIIRGNSCANAARTTTMILDFTSPALECKYEKSAASPLVGTFTTHPEDARLTAANQEYLLESGGSFLCPATLKMDWTFTMERDSPTVEAAYIS